MKSVISLLSLGVLALLSSSVGMAAGVTFTSDNYNPVLFENLAGLISGG